MATEPLLFPTDADRTERKVRGLSRGIRDMAGQTARAERNLRRLERQQARVARSAALAERRANVGAGLAGAGRIGGTLGAAIGGAAESAGRGGVIGAIGVAALGIGVAGAQIMQAFDRVAESAKRVSEAQTQVANITRQGTRQAGATAASGLNQSFRALAFESGLRREELASVISEATNQGLQDPVATLATLFRAGFERDNIGDALRAVRIAEGTGRAFDASRLSPAALERLGSERAAASLLGITAAELGRGYDGVLGTGEFRSLARAQAQVAAAPQTQLLTEDGAFRAESAVRQQLGEIVDPVSAALVEYQRGLDAQIRALQAQAEATPKLIRVFQDFTRTQGSAETQARRQASENAAIFL